MRWNGINQGRTFTISSLVAETVVIIAIHSLNKCSWINIFEILFPDIFKVMDPRGKGTEPGRFVTTFRCSNCHETWQMHSTSSAKVAMTCRRCGTRTDTKHFVSRKCFCFWITMNKLREILIVYLLLTDLSVAKTVRRKSEHFWWMAERNTLDFLHFACIHAVKTIILLKHIDVVLINVCDNVIHFDFMEHPVEFSPTNVCANSWSSGLRINLL